MERPNSLFRYESITLQSLRNLKGQVIHLGSPRNFNDPYDCAFGAILGDLTDEDLARLLDGVKVNATDETLKSMYRESVRKTLSGLTEQFLDRRGVSCFTESNDNLLMWAHYADGGRGMCLEFSTAEPLFEKARKVTYADSIPTVELGSLLCNEEYDLITDLFRTKSAHWKYEEEWRVVHEAAGTNWVYESTSLLGVYFGPNTPSDLLAIACLILKGQNDSVRLYKGARSEITFKVEFQEAKYVTRLEELRAGLK
jgi:Protein of unknown function (DUF2971)